MSNSIIGPIVNTTKKQRIAEAIRQAILSGKLLPGHRIVEMQLAKDLEVGNTAVREALLELEAKGFVQRITNKGTFITQLTVDEVVQIFQARREMEGLAAELFSERATKQDLDLLQKYVDEMGRAVDHHSLEDFCRYDIDFHTALWRLSGNRFLAAGLENMVLPLLAFFNITCPPESVESLRESVAQHARVVQAIRDRRDVRARIEMALEYFQLEKLQLMFKPSNE